MHRVLKFMLVIPMIAAVLSFSVVQAFAQAGTADLVNTNWKLREISRPDGTARGTSDLNITLSFNNQGGITGLSTCNGFGGMYSVGVNNGLILTEIISTLRACEEQELNELESEYFAALNTVTSYTTDGSTLRLSYANGGVLTFGASGPLPTPGMPVTGSGFADVAPLAIGGLFMVMFGSSLVFWARTARQ